MWRATGSISDSFSFVDSAQHQKDDFIFQINDRAGWKKVSERIRSYCVTSGREHVILKVLDLGEAQLLSLNNVWLLVTYLEIKLGEITSGCDGSAVSGFLLWIRLSDFKFSFLKVLVQLPCGNNKVAVRYDKGVEKTQLLIAVVKEERWVYEPIEQTCKMEWAAGPYKIYI